jgi:rhamnulokinase
MHPLKRDWATGMIRKFGLPARIFPEVVLPGAPLGMLRPSVAATSGLPSVSVIAPPTHDTASAVAAVPTAHTGKANWAYLSSGTWSLMGVEIQQASLSKRTLDMNLTNEGGLDGTYRLLKNIMGLWLIQQCKRAFEAAGKSYDYAELSALASKAPPLRSLVNPDDAGFLNPPDMPKAIQDYCRKTRQPVPATEGELVRCATESLALRYRMVMAWLEELTGEDIEVIHIVGGGAKNRLLNQMTADACGRPVVTGPVEATALGNLLVQARAGGELGSLREIREASRKSCELTRYEPAATAAWREAAERFEELPVKPA